jgi:hypothetical protein
MPQERLSMRKTSEVLRLKKVCKLSGQVSRLQMETACQMALQAKLLNYRGFKEILENLPPSVNQETLPSLPIHENIRGESYYQ